MNLLSTSDWAEIRSVIHDVTDTFLKKPIYYVQRTTRKLSKFHGESRKGDLVENVYLLYTLIVAEKNDHSYSQVDKKREGFLDLSEGYLLFSFPDLRDFSPSMINSDGKPVFLANKDSFFVDGDELTITGINLVGPTETDYQLVKVHFKKQLNPGTPPAGVTEYFDDYFDDEFA